MAIFANENGTLKTLSDVQGATSPINIDLIFENITFNKNDSDGSYVLMFNQSTGSITSWKQYFICYKKLGIINISKYRKLILLNFSPTKISTTTWPECKVNNIGYGTFPESQKSMEQIYETDTNFIESYSKNFLDDNKQYPFGISLARINYYSGESYLFGLPYNTETGEIYLRARSEIQGSSFDLYRNYSLLGILK